MIFKWNLAAGLVIKLIIVRHFQIISITFDR